MEFYFSWFRIMPPFNIGEGFIRMAYSHVNREAGMPSNVLQWNVCGKSIFLLYALSLPFFAILLLLEYSADTASGGLIGHVLHRVRHFKDRFAFFFHHGVVKYSAVKQMDEEAPPD